MKTRVKNQSAFEEKSKDLLDFARNYLSNAFPNPHREGPPPATPPRSLAWTRVHPVLVGTAAVCALLIAIGAGLLLRRSRLPNTPPAETHRTPASVEPLNSAVVYAPFGLDLSALSRVRGSESSATVPQRLAVPSSPLDLTLTLPL